MDSDMMDTDSSPPPPTPAAEVDSLKNLLTMARQLIDQGNPSQALHAKLLGGALKPIGKIEYHVVIAMKQKGGDEAVVKLLDRARELYRNKLQTSAADELASLFAECAITEAAPVSQHAGAELSQTNTIGQPFEPDALGTSILAETGRKQIMLDTFSDGSSFVCLQCGGLVSSQRKDEHDAYWCCKI